MTSATPKPSKARTAVLIMDFQNDIVKMATDPAAVLEAASAVLAGARAAGVAVIHVQHRGGAFAADSPGVAFHRDVQPAATDTVFVKTKTGAFSTTALDVHLREKGIDALALMGVATSGCVLTTVRWAYDLGYKVIVIGDACGDRDEEVHRVLIDKIFPRQAVVTIGREFLQSIA